MRKQSDLSGDEANSQVTCKVRNRDLVDKIPPKHQAEPFKKNNNNFSLFAVVQLKYFACLTNDPN